MIDNNMVEQARCTDIIDFLEQRRGFTFIQRGGTFRCKEHESLAIKADRLSWYWHSQGVGGFGALDYMIKIENMTFREALEAVAGITPVVPPPQQAEAPPKILMLPEKRGIPMRLCEYLCCKRGLDANIVNKLIQEEKLYEDRRGNVVFVGHDKSGKARFASLRGTSDDSHFRMDCSGSDKRYSFHMGPSAPSDRLYIFESPIDAMSHASLANAENGDKTAWENDRRLSLSGTGDTALASYLNQYEPIRELVFCLDNDEPGRDAASNLAQKYAQIGYITRIQLPQGKDFNEDLQTYVKQIRIERHTQHQQREEDTL